MQGIEENCYFRHRYSRITVVIGRSLITPYLLKTKKRPAYTKNLTVVANELNQFFSKVVKNSADASRHLSEENNITIRELSTDANTSSTPDELFNLRTVTCEEVRRVIASLPLNKSPGPEKVSARIQKGLLACHTRPFD